MKLYFQSIISDIPFENLPAKWQGFDFSRFSKDKTLFDFQKQALQNALNGLWLYFIDKESDKQKLFQHYQNNGLEENFDYNLNRERKSAKYLLEYPDNYPVINNKISFAHFINRMSFWMATGSGKTLIIVKLIELLGKLIAQKELPTRDILFLAHRDDLLDQFKNHIEEFNSFNFDTKINLKNLRDYESMKRENVLPFSKNEITVFYYRSDLISDQDFKKKDTKIIKYTNYDKNGEWYILLDEAHKGDKEDSKRQILYSILSRNGFLFNFSATFTDPRDFATCAFRFNLADFIRNGYGKHIYLSSSEIDAFRRKDDFSKLEKQKIVLKTLILLTYIHKYFEKIRRYEKTLYHRPLLLALVNSVNKPDADLQLFFREIENIAREKPRLFDSAKEEIINELSDYKKYQFEDDLEFVFDKKIFVEIGYEDILKYVYNTKKPGTIEISFRPSDKSQVAFKLTTSDRYFALIKTGEMPEWLKNELNRFNINHRFETEGFFQQINRDDSDINILMGSRSFYEGWDSNRPNMILFVNIGIGNDAKKFVLQSIGRGVRIEPQKHKRRRIKELLNIKEIKEQLFNKIKNLVLPIKTLFVFGTKVDIVEKIIDSLKPERQEKSLGNAFILNPEAQKHTLLVPVYKTVERIFAEEEDPQKYPVSREDFDLTSQFYRFLGDKIALAKYDCEVKVLKKAKESFIKKERYYDFNERNSLLESELILDRIFNYLGVKSKEFKKFKELEKEIVHFEKVRFTDGEKYEEILEAIGKVKNYHQKETQERKIDAEFERTKNKEKYKQSLRQLELDFSREIKLDRLQIKYIQNHYYLPVIVSETEKIDYLNHIINVDSEVKFIEQLEEYLAKPDNVFTQFDWWMFSKLDQTLDEVFIPYYNHKENRINDYHPDFIFWLQKGNDYLILFVDPHGTAYSDINKKIDYYSKIFEIEEKGIKKSKKFPFYGLNIKTKLLLMSADGGIGSVGENYKQYWFDNFVDFASKIS